MSHSPRHSLTLGMLVLIGCATGPNTESKNSWYAPDMKYIDLTRDFALCESDSASQSTGRCMAERGYSPVPFSTEAWRRCEGLYQSRLSMLLNILYPRGLGSQPEPVQSETEQKIANIRAHWVSYYEGGRLPTPCAETATATTKPEENPSATYTLPPDFYSRPDEESQQEQPIKIVPQVVLEGDPEEHGGRKVYSADECIGAVVNGVCHGSVIDTDPGRPKCYGGWISGKCTGPQF